MTCFHQGCAVMSSILRSLSSLVGFKRSGKAESFMFRSIGSIGSIAFGCHGAMEAVCEARCATKPNGLCAKALAATIQLTEEFQAANWLALLLRSEPDGRGQCMRSVQVVKL